MKEELVFNLDEVNMLEWEDWKDRKVTVAKTMDGPMMHHRASQNVRYTSIITYITAGRESLTPYIMTSLDSEPVRRRLMSRGARLSVDFVLY
jgi:hypothetical protein